VSGSNLIAAVQWGRSLMVKVIHQIHYVSHIYQAVIGCVPYAPRIWGRSSFVDVSDEIDDITNIDVEVCVCIAGRRRVGSELLHGSQGVDSTRTQLTVIRVISRYAVDVVGCTYYGIPDFLIRGEKIA
jgi:hypothetical protein